VRDVVSVGDATIDCFVDLKEAEVEVRGDEQELHMPFATKVPMKKRVRLVPAGNCNNTAVGFARLGLGSAYYGVVGSDPNAQIILKNLLSNGVDTTLVGHDAKRGTNFHVVLSFGPERTILIYHEQYAYRLPEPLHTQWMYFSSVGKTGAADLQLQVIERVKEEGIKLAFNPGTFQLELGVGALRPLLEVVETLFVNVQEAELLLGKDGLKPAELLKGLHEFGPRTVVITDGPAGSYASDGKEKLFLPIFDALPAVERTGAGDGYATAFVAARIKGKTLSEAMRWGTFNSGSVLGYVGPQEGLLTRDALDDFLEQNPDFQPKKP
jgi:ribokinase